MSRLSAIGHSSHFRGCIVASFALRYAINAASANKDYIQDFIKFNAFHRLEQNKTYPKLLHYDLPSCVVNRLRTLEDSGFDGCSKADIRRKLGMWESSSYEFSPLEAKFVFAYISKFQTDNYLEGNHVTDEEILAPLTDVQAAELARII